MTTTFTAAQLEALPMSRLVELHNQHAAAPVKRFSDRRAAVRRTLAVLPAAPVKPAKPASPAKPAKARPAAAEGGDVRRRSDVLNMVEGALRGGATLETLMADTGASAAKVRAMIDRIRRRGVRVIRTGPSAWSAQD